MVLEVSEKDKIAYYWLSNEEKEDEAFRESLKPDYRKWNKMGYKVCVFLSGKRRYCRADKRTFNP